MKLIKLYVENYRALKNCLVDISDDLTVVIGKNNTGKTSLAGILSKFLGGASFVYDDLNLAAKKSLYAEVIGESVSEVLPPSMSLTLVIRYTDEDTLKNIRSLLLDLDENNHEVGIRFTRFISLERLESCRDDFRAYCSGLEPGCTSELFEKFMSQNHDKYYKTEVVPIYCHDGKFDLKRTGTPLKADDISRVIRFEYIDALRGVSNKESSSTLGDRISNYYSMFKGSSLVEASKNLLGTLLEMDSQLSDVYSELFENLSKAMQQFGSYEDAGAHPEVVSCLSEQDLLANNTTVRYRSGEYDLPESHSGLGYMNIMSIIMDIIAKSEKMKHDSDGRNPAEVNLLFIEEPEAHTHPQLQTIFMKQIKDLIEKQRRLDDGGELSLQCIMTTHSSHIVANAAFEDMRYFVRDMASRTDEVGISVHVKDLNSLRARYGKESDQGRANYKFIKQYLTLDRADIFFADKVILMEGDTERILMPSMMKKVDIEHATDNGWTPLLSQEISVIPVGAYAYIFLPLMVFLGHKTLIVTDSDFVKNEKRCACEFSELEATSNQTIKWLLPEETNDPAKLKELYTNEEMHTFSYKDSNDESCNSNTEIEWEPDSRGMLGLTFQTGIEGGYHPRSFEDAFINENRVFLEDHIDSFKSIQSEKAKESFRNTSVTPYKLAQLIEKKTSFAMDILIAEQMNSANGGSEEWNVPSYIERGLVWLARD